MRPMIRRIAISLMAVGLVVAAVPAIAKSLKFTVDKQEQSQWCWAASANSVIRHVTGGTSYSQCELVQAGLLSADCPDEAALFSVHLDRVYSYAGVSGGTLINRMPIWDEITQDIKSGTPIQIRYGYHSSSLITGHIVAIIGHSGQNTVYWGNPAYGTTMSGSYSHLSNNVMWKTTHSRYRM